MSVIEPKPLAADTRKLLPDDLKFMRRFDPLHYSAALDYAETLWAHVLWLEQREAHVIAVLRQGERCGGGYGFARELLRYLGADQEGQ